MASTARERGPRCPKAACRSRSDDARYPGAPRLHPRPAARPLGSRTGCLPWGSPPWPSSGRGRPRPTRRTSRIASARDLAARSVVVVSGLARGVDICGASGLPRRAVGPRLPCSGRVSAGSIRRPTSRIAATISRKGCIVSELWHRADASAGALSAPEPYHLRDLARRGRRRSVGEERVAHHRPLRPRAGQGRHGGARQRPVGP